MRLGNRVTEKDLREWLDRHGWIGRSAKVKTLELHALQRPGWVQVFQFSVFVKKRLPDDDDLDPTASDNVKSADNSDAGRWHQYWGAIRDDERATTDKTLIWMFENEKQQAAKLDQLSQDLIVLRQGETGAGFLVLVAMMIALFTFVAIIKWIFRS